MGPKRDLVNGMYRMTTEVSGNMPVYKKKGGDQVLEYILEKKSWMSKHASNKGQDNFECNARAICELGTLPYQIKTQWEVFVSNQFWCQNSVKANNV